MHQFHLIALRAISRIAKIQLWHLQRLQDPLYRTAMHLLAALLTGRISIQQLRQWLTDLLDFRGTYTD